MFFPQRLQRTTAEALRTGGGMAQGYAGNLWNGKQKAKMISLFFA
jgi:hypothetical protein